MWTASDANNNTYIVQSIHYNLRHRVAFDFLRCRSAVHHTRTRSRRMSGHEISVRSEGSRSDSEGRFLQCPGLIAVSVPQQQTGAFLGLQVVEFLQTFDIRFMHHIGMDVL